MLKGFTNEGAVMEAVQQDQGVEKAVAVLLDRIVPALAPEAVYLFGSRARGDASRGSDFDLLVVVSDDTPRDRILLTSTCRLNRGTGIPADVIACRRRWFERDREQVGTLSYKAIHEGSLVYGQ
jgi:predicted nucleotidyltransferase